MSDPAQRIVDAVRLALPPLADADDAQAMQAYMKTETPYFGIKAPARREATKAALATKLPDRASYERAVLGLWALPERENRYVAVDLAKKHKRFIVPESLPLYERLVREGAWWDLVDPVATHLVGGVFARHRAQLTPMIWRWSEDPDLWIRRTAVISQLRHRADTDAELLFELCRRRAHETDFFMRKAIGWALRQHARHDPEAVLAFLEDNRDALSGLSKREAAKHLDWK